MTVSEILSEKGRAVITARPEDPLHDVSKILAEKKIGAIVVRDDKEEVCGITSERDIVRQIARGGADALNDPVSNCMTRDVIFCTEAETINEVMEKMTQGRFRHLPVMNNGQLVGIISIGDVVKRKIEQVERDAEELKRYIAS